MVLPGSKRLPSRELRSHLSILTWGIVFKYGLFKDLKFKEFAMSYAVSPFDEIIRKFVAASGFTEEVMTLSPARALIDEDDLTQPDGMPFSSRLIQERPSTAKGICLCVHCAMAAQSSWSMGPILDWLAISTPV